MNGAAPPHPGWCGWGEQYVLRVRLSVPAAASRRPRPQVPAHSQPDGGLRAGSAHMPPSVPTPAARGVWNFPDHPQVQYFRTRRTHRTHSFFSLQARDTGEPQPGRRTPSRVQQHGQHGASSASPHGVRTYRCMTVRVEPCQPGNFSFHGFHSGFIT